GEGGFGGGENEAPPILPPPFVKTVPVDVPDERDARKIIHAGTPQVAVGNVEAGGFDDVDAKPKAGGQSKDGAGVARNVGLVEGDTKSVVDVAHGGFLRKGVLSAQAFSPSSGCDMRATERPGKDFRAIASFQF